MVHSGGKYDQFVATKAIFPESLVCLATKGICMQV